MWACRCDSLFRISQCTGKSDCVLVCAETAALPAGSQQYLPAVSAAEAELRAMVHSVDHSDACWYYIDPQVSSQESLSCITELVVHKHSLVQSGRSLSSLVYDVS